MDWDAEGYHRVSEPQVAWGHAVLDRLAPRPGERILDLGCGTGRLTAAVAALTQTFVVGADRSPSMLAEAAGHRIPRAAWVRVDATALPFVECVDAVFSTATFHWIHDHDRLFVEIFGALSPGGRLVAQCGGGPNLSGLLHRAGELMQNRRYASAFRGWQQPWHFAGVDDTRARLEAAGFDEVDVSLVAAPTVFADAAAYAEFVACVPLRHHLAALPPDDREPFVGAITGAASADDPPFTLDYWRLNMSAVRPS